MKKLLVTVFLFAFGLLAAYGNSDVSLVKDGTMNGYETTTIGKAFEASFDDTKWEGFEGKKGERVVQFTGKISKDLHNSVTDEVRQQLKGLEYFEASQFKLSLFRAAVKKFGGDESNYFQKLNKKYGCELKRVYYTGGIGWSPECKKEETKFQYIDEVIDALLDESWKAGEAVEVRWIVTPDGRRFNLSHMGSAAWQGLTFDNILAVIYK